MSINKGRTNVRMEMKEFNFMNLCIRKIVSPNNRRTCMRIETKEFKLLNSHLSNPHDPDALAILRAPTSWVLGDGSRCRFWSDHWLEPESMHHLLVGCSFSMQLSHELLAWCHCTSGPPQLNGWFRDCCMTSCVAPPSPSRKGLSSLLLIGARLLW